MLRSSTTYFLSLVNNRLFATSYGNVVYGLLSPSYTLLPRRRETCATCFSDPSKHGPLSDLFSPPARSDFASRSTICYNVLTLIYNTILNYSSEVASCDLSVTPVSSENILRYEIHCHTSIYLLLAHTFGPCRLVVRSSRCGLFAIREDRGSNPRWDTFFPHFFIDRGTVSKAYRTRRACSTAHFDLL